MFLVAGSLAIVLPTQVPAPCLLLSLLTTGDLQLGSCSVGPHIVVITSNCICPSRITLPLNVSQKKRTLKVSINSIYSNRIRYHLLWLMGLHCDKTCPNIHPCQCWVVPETISPRDDQKCISCLEVDIN